MSARLSSLIVAGGVALLGMQSGSPALAASTLDTVAGKTTLTGISLSVPSEQGVTVLRLDIPEFVGVPRVQVLSHPNRIVIDLPGVIRGVTPSKQDIAGLKNSLIQRTRLAQFVVAPEPVTRLVLEVSAGVQATVSPQKDGVNISLQPSTGMVQAKVVPTDQILQSSAAHSEVVVAAAPSLVGTADTTGSSGSLAVQATTPAPAATAVSTILPNKPLEQNVKVAAIPTVSSASPAAQPLAISALLPSAVAVAQEKPAANTTPAKKEEVRGRTLGDAQGRYSGSRITIDVKGAELSTFLRIIADHAKLNLVADQDVQGIYDFKFTDTPWDQVLDIIVKHANLGMEISNGVIRVAKVEKLQKEEDDRKKLTEAKALAGDLVTVTRPLSFAKATETKPIIEKMLTKRGTLIVDDRTNVVIISDLAKNLPVIDDLIQQLDIQIQQVQIEARIIEANGNYEKAFGVKWPTTNAQGGATGPSSGSWGALNQPSWNSVNSRPTGTTSWMGAFNGGNSGVTSLASPAGELWVSFLSNRMSVNVILQALEKDGKIRIVSNPKVVTQNNKKATILAGSKIPYPTRQSGDTAGAITVQFVDANLQLDVTPQITSDGTIIMDLQIEKAEPDFSNSVNGTPSIIRRFIDTQVLVKDGGTAVLGGIYITRTDQQTTGVPYLSKLPILGFLFRMKDNKESNAELLVFITPRIIKM